MRLLLAEDDRDISKALVTILEKNNYCVDAVFDGKSAFSYALTGQYDGIVLDIMMPEMDGIEVLTKLRSQKITTPVMMLTAKSETDDRVLGFDSGADDYLPKPFAMTELLARVRAMLRRRGNFQPEIVKAGNLALNKSTFEIEYTGHSMRLVSREYQVMELLMENAGMVIETDRMMEHIWGWDSDVEVSIVWVTISNLRKKLALIGAPSAIHAIRGVGYLLEKV
jgi:DNA-binding response OmpR family regulator